MSLSKDTFFYSLAHWGRRLIGFIVTPVMIRYFTPADYGYMSLVNTMASFCSILGILAVAEEGLPRFFIDTKDELEKTGYVSTSYLISGIGVVVISLMIFIVTPLVPLVFHDVKLPLVFTSLVALLCFSLSVQNVGSNMLKWTFQAPFFMKILFIQTVSGAVLTILGIVVFGWKANEVLLTSALIGLGAGIWANVLIKKYIKLSTISKRKTRELIVYSWPLLGLNIFSFFTRSLDRIFIASLSSLGKVGIFSISSSVAHLFEIFVSGFFFAWGPYVISTFRKDDAPQRYAQFFSAFSCFGIISIIALGLWGSPIVRLIRPDGVYHEIGVFIPWILSGTLLYYLGGYFSPGPFIAKQTHWKFIAFVLSATTNAILNYILIPRLGILGAGIATTTSSLIAGSFNQIVSNRFYYIPNRWRLSFGMILVFTAIISLMQYKKNIYNINDISFSLRFIITILLSIIGILPFFKDIQKSGLLQTFIVKIVKKFF